MLEGLVLAAGIFLLFLMGIGALTQMQVGTGGALLLGWIAFLGLINIVIGVGMLKAMPWAWGLQITFSAINVVFHGLSGQFVSISGSISALILVLLVLPASREFFREGGRHYRQSRSRRRRSGRPTSNRRRSS